MKRKETAYQRIQLDGKWYAVLPEDDFQALTREKTASTAHDELDAFNVSDQRLADRLVQRRKEAGLTQKDLAKQAGLRVETLNRIEKGRTTPDFKSIRKLVQAINSHKEGKTGGAP